MPVKTGVATLEIIEKQLGRIGLTRYDVKAGTGDGGGENEGVSGIHAILETTGQGYVRRRCFAHLPWRVADQGIAAIPHHASTAAICTYLCDGVTWTRLRAIAVQAPSAGGVGMFRPQSRAEQDFFRTAPPSLIEDRPECVTKFLAWLLPRHERLRALAEKDMTQRNLVFASAPLALASLQSREHFFLRHVYVIMIRKGLYLWYCNQKEPWVIRQGTFADLVTKASLVIMDKSIDDYVLDVFAITQAKAAELAAERFSYL